MLTQRRGRKKWKRSIFGSAIGRRSNEQAVFSSLSFSPSRAEFGPGTLASLGPGPLCVARGPESGASNQDFCYESGKGPFWPFTAPCMHMYMGNPTSTGYKLFLLLRLLLISSLSLLCIVPGSTRGNTQVPQIYVLSICDFPLPCLYNLGLF